jgi:hypothetical protein
LFVLYSPERSLGSPAPVSFRQSFPLTGARPLFSHYTIPGPWECFSSQYPDHLILINTARRQELSSDTTASASATAPPPLNIPTRARRQLAARLAQRHRAAAAATTTDINPTTGQRTAEGGLDTVDLGPGTEDAQQNLHSAFEPFDDFAEAGEPGGFYGDDGEEGYDLGPATEREIAAVEWAVRRRSGQSRGRAESSDEEAGEDEDVEEVVREMLAERRTRGAQVGDAGSSDGEDEEIVGLRDQGRRPSTTEAKVRRPLDDDDDDEDEEEGNEVMDEPWMQRSGRVIPGERKERSPFADSAEAEDSSDGADDDDDDDDDDGDGLIEIGSRRRVS